MPVGLTKKPRGSRRTLILPDMPGVSPRRASSAAPCNEGLAQILVARGAHADRHSTLADCSGYRLARPARLAEHTPRSVMRPVTNLAGVTSKA